MLYQKMLIVPRKLLTLLGGLMIISDFADAGMVPISNPKPAGRPPLAKPISTPGINPNQNAYRPERPQTHTSGILTPAPQQPISFGITTQQKPPTPSSYSSSQSSAGNSQSHLIFTQNNIGEGSDPVLIVSSTLNAVNETENTHNVPLEQIPSIFTAVLTPSSEDISLESTHDQSFSVPPQNIIHEQAQQTAEITPGTGNIPISIQASPAELILEAASEFPSTDSFEAPSNTVHEPSSPSVSDELPLTIPANETPAMPAAISIDESQGVTSEVIFSVSHESLQSDPQESLSEVSTVQHIINSETHSQSHVSPESSPIPVVSPAVQNSATTEVIQNSNIAEEQHHFDLNDYLAQASVALEGGATPDVQQTNEVSSAAVESSIEGHDASVTLEEPSPNVPSITSFAESTPVNEQPSMHESVQPSPESIQVQEEPLPNFVSPEIDTNPNEILPQHVVPDHISAIEVSSVSAVPSEESSVVGSLAENHEVFVPQVTDQNENVHLTSHVEETPVVENLEVSQVPPVDIPNNVQDHSEPLDSHANGESNSENNLDNIEEHSVLSELLSPVSSGIPSSDVSSVPGPSGINPTTTTTDAENESAMAGESNEVSPNQVDHQVSVEYTSLSAAPPPTNYNSQPQQMNDEEDPPFNVEQYLAQAALILGSSQYQPYEKHVSAKELYYSDRHKIQQSSGHPLMSTGKGITGGNLIKSDQYYTHVNSEEANRASSHSNEPTREVVQNENSLENMPLSYNPKTSTNAEIIKSNEVISHGAPAVLDSVVPVQSAQHNVRPLPPGLNAEQLDENDLLTVANLEDTQNEVFSAPDGHADQVVSPIQNVVETEESQVSIDDDDLSSSKIGTERARPPRPGMARPSQLGIAPLYTYSGGKLNTPVGEDIKLTHGSLSTANSKNQNGTFSLLHDTGKAPQHSMVSHLGSTAFNSYFNGSHVAVPTNTASFTTAQSPKPQLTQAQPSMQHAVLNNTNIVGSLGSTQNKPTEPSAYHNYYFPQDSIKSANILINNGIARPVPIPSTEKGSEESLIPQLESEIAGSSNDLDTLGTGQSVLDLLSQDRKKAGASGSNSNMVKRTTTSASGKSLGKKPTNSDKSPSPVVAQEDKAYPSNESSDAKVSEHEDPRTEDDEEENGPEKIGSELNEGHENVEATEPEALESLEQPLETSASQVEEQEEFQHETLTTEEKEQESSEEEIVAIFPNSTIEEKDDETEQELTAPIKPKIPNVNPREESKEEKISPPQPGTKDPSTPVKQQGEKPQPNKPKPQNSNANEMAKDEKIVASEMVTQESPTPAKQQAEKPPQNKQKPGNSNAKETTKGEKIPAPQNNLQEPSTPVKQQVEESPSMKPKVPNAKEPSQDPKAPVHQKDTQESANPSKQLVDEPTSSSKPVPAKESPPKSPPPSQPSQKDSAPPAAGPSGPSLPQPPPAPILVAPPPIPDAMSAPSLGEISIPEPNINTPNVPQDISGMIGTVNIPPIPTFGDGSKSSNNKGLPASPGKPKPPKKPNQAPGKGNSPQIPKPLASQQAFTQTQEQEYYEVIENQSEPMEISSETVDADIESEELAISEEITPEENEMEASEEDDELSPNVSYNESNEDTRKTNGKEQPFSTEKALPPKHGRPFPPGFGNGNPNPMFGTNSPHGAPFPNAPTPFGSSSAAPDKGCTCNSNNNNNNPNDNYSAGNNNPNTNNNANTGGKNPTENTGGGGKNPNDNNGGGKYTPPSKNNTPSKNNPAPAPTAAPAPTPVIDVESEDDAQSNVRPPRPTKPKRPKPNGGNKKPKPKPSTDKNSDKLKDVEVEDDIDHLLFQNQNINITFSDSRPTSNKKPDNKVEVETPLVSNSSLAVVNATTTPVKQTELISTVNVFGWEIPYINWSYFTDIFQSFFVEKFRTSSGEFTCDESDNEVTILRSELDVDYLCGDDADFSRRDVRTLGESNICNMFCSANGFSSGTCMPQKSCLCYMSDTRNFAIKLERLQDYNNNSTEKFTSDSEDACQKCRCLKSCQTRGKYVGYCSKSCHCGVPWYNENPTQEVPIK